MREPARLRRLEEFLQAVIVHPGSTAAAVRSRRARTALPAGARAILPSATMTALERLDVYHGMYPLRMRDALVSDYPGVAAFLGEEKFFSLVLSYVRRFPSRSYTLDRLGDHLPDFLARTGRFPARPFLRELARLELEVSKAFDAPEAAAREGRPLPKESDWSEVRFEANPTLRLLKLRYPVGEALDRLKAGSSAGRIRARASFVAIHRREFAVYRVDLTRAAFALLTLLVSGQALGKALSRAARRFPTALDEHTVARLFRQWVAEGILYPIAASNKAERVERRPR